MNRKNPTMGGEHESGCVVCGRLDLRPRVLVEYKRGRGAGNGPQVRSLSPTPCLPKYHRASASGLHGGLDLRRGGPTKFGVRMPVRCEKRL